jgi:hypothetical protein
VLFRDNVHRRVRRQSQDTLQNAKYPDASDDAEGACVEVAAGEEDSAGEGEGYGDPVAEDTLQLC